MIRILMVLGLVLFVSPSSAAPAIDTTVVEPALQQCILAALSPEEDGSSPLITDCVSVGSAACRNADGGSSDSVIIKCNNQEMAFWAALTQFEMTELRSSLKSAARASLRTSERAWVAWKAARCDLVRKTEKNQSLVAADVSYCEMETVALRAIDLMAVF